VIDTPEDVVLEFRPEAANAAGGDFGKGAVREDGEDGSVRVSFSCANLDYVVSRLLAAKGDIRIISGDRLGERLAAEIAAVAGHYEDRSR